MNKAAIHIHLQVFRRTDIFISLGQITQIIFTTHFCLSNLVPSSSSSTEWFRLPSCLSSQPARLLQPSQATADLCRGPRVPRPRQGSLFSAGGVSSQPCQIRTYRSCVISSQIVLDSGIRSRLSLPELRAFVRPRLMLRYSQFSSLKVVLFSEASTTLNHGSQGRYRLRFPQASGHSIFINQSIVTFFSTCLFKDALFNIYGSLTPSSPQGTPGLGPNEAHPTRASSP